MHIEWREEKFLKGILCDNMRQEHDSMRISAI